MLLATLYITALLFSNVFLSLLTGSFLYLLLFLSPHNEGSTVTFCLIDLPLVQVEV